MCPPARTRLSRAGACECVFVGRCVAALAGDDIAVPVVARAKLAATIRARTIARHRPARRAVARASNATFPPAAFLPSGDATRIREPALGGRRGARLVGLRGDLSCMESIRTAVDQPMVSSRVSSVPCVARRVDSPRHVFRWPIRSVPLISKPLLAASLRIVTRAVTWSWAVSPTAVSLPAVSLTAVPPRAICSRAMSFRRVRSLQQGRAPLPRLDAQ